MAKLPFRIPNLENASIEHITDELGKVKSALKVLKRLEEFYKVAWKARNGERTSIEGESYIGELSTGERTAIDQKKAKAILEKLGVDPKEYMASSDTQTLRVDLKTIGKPVTHNALVDMLGSVLPEAVGPESD